MFGRNAKRQAPRGTRRERREAKRARILAAARPLLVADGAESLSLREVAREAGVSPAGMYEFFQSKAHLLEELGAAARAALAKSMAASVRRHEQPRERLVALGVAYVRFALRQPEDFLLLFGRLVSRRRSLLQDVGGDSPYALIRGAVAAVIGPDRLAKSDPRALEAFAYGYWSTVHGMAMLRLTHLAGFRADFDIASRLVLKSLVEGIGSAKA